VDFVLFFASIDECLRKDLFNLTKNQKFSVAVSIFIGVFLVALFTSPPKLPRGEGLDMLEVSAKIFKHGFREDKLLENGEQFSRYELGEPILTTLFVPAYLKAKGAKGSYEFITANLFLHSFPSLIFALTAVLLFLTSLQFGNSTSASLILTFASSFATMLWHQSQTFFADAVVGLLLLATLYFLHQYKKTAERTSLLLGGFSLGYAVLTEVTLITVVPFFTIYLLYIMLAESNYFLTEQTNGKRKPFPALLFTCFLLALLTPIALLLWYNNLRYGSPFTIASGGEENGNSGFLLGIYRLLFSTGKGLFFYNPILLLAVFGMHKFYRKHLEESLLIFALIVSCSLIYANGWDGGSAWGPRVFTTLIPLIVLLAGNLVEELLKSWELSSFFGWAKRGGGILLLSLSLLIQIPSILINPNDSANLQSDKFSSSENRLYRNFVPQFSPLAVHIWMAKSVYYRGTQKYQEVSTSPPWKGAGGQLAKKVDPSTFEYNIWWLNAKQLNSPIAGKAELSAFFILFLSGLSFLMPIYIYKHKELKSSVRFLKVLFVMFFPRQNLIELKKDQNKENLASNI